MTPPAPAQYGYTTDNSTNGRAVEIYEKAQLRVAANEFLFYVRGYVSGIHLGSDPYNRSMALSDEVLARDRAILFGNDGTGLAGTLQASKRESVLQLEDGCSYDGAVPACSTFYVRRAPHRTLPPAPKGAAASYPFAGVPPHHRMAF